MFSETGHVLSDAARRVYAETGSLSDAYEYSQGKHAQWIDVSGGMGDYPEAHGALGHELTQALGMERTFISTTTDLEVSKYFAQGGSIFRAQVQKSLLIPQTLTGAAESEWLLPHRSSLFSLFK